MFACQLVNNISDTKTTTLAVILEATIKAYLLICATYIYYIFHNVAAFDFKSVYVQAYTDLFCFSYVSIK